MKKDNLRSFGWCFLMAASLSCYLYLNSLDAESYNRTDGITTSRDLVNKEQDSKVHLPDIALVKKIINITKIVMPKD